MRERKSEGVRGRRNGTSTMLRILSRLYARIGSESGGDGRRRRGLAADPQVHLPEVFPYPSTHPRIIQKIFKKRKGRTPNLPEEPVASLVP